MKKAQGQRTLLSFFSARRSKGAGTGLFYWAASRHRLFLYWPISRCTFGFTYVWFEVPEMRSSSSMVLVSCRGTELPYHNFIFSRPKTCGYFQSNTFVLSKDNALSTSIPSRTRKLTSIALNLSTSLPLFARPSAQIVQFPLLVAIFLTIPTDVNIGRNTHLFIEVNIETSMI